MLTKSRLNTRGCLAIDSLKCFTALDTGRHVADDMAEAALPLRVALFVKRGHRLDERNAGLDHRRELPGKQNQIGLFDRPALFLLAASGGFLLEGENHEPATHQTGDGVVLVEGVLDTGYDIAGRIAGLIGEGASYGNYSSIAATMLTIPARLMMPVELFLNMIPIAMAEASDLDSSGPWRLFWQVYDPAVKADLFSTAVKSRQPLFLVDPIPLAPAPCRSDGHIGPRRCRL